MNTGSTPGSDLKRLLLCLAVAGALTIAIAISITLAVSVTFNVDLVKLTQIILCRPISLCAGAPPSGGGLCFLFLFFCRSAWLATQF